MQYNTYEPLMDLIRTFMLYVSKLNSFKGLSLSVIQVENCQ